MKTLSFVMGMRDSVAYSQAAPPTRGAADHAPATMSTLPPSPGQDPRFRHAAEAIAAELAAHDDVIGLLYFGSSQRGEARPLSDVDVYAITSRESTRHLGRVVDQVLVEVSFGSVGQMKGRIRS
ncbi:MAG: nucleotidyltransferase domain-containing protein [Anaeromyxobacter sp.]